MVYFIGAGPGNPKLITLMGAELIGRADVIIYTGSLVNPAILKTAPAACLIYDSSVLNLEQVIALIEKNREKPVIIRLHTGDPALYSAIAEQRMKLESLGIPHKTIPGVSSFFAAAAAINAEFTLPGISQSLIISRIEGRTPMPKNESIKKLAAIGATMVFFLSASRIKELVLGLLAGAYKANTPAAIVYKASWPEEKIFCCRLEHLEETAQKNGITKTALILVGDVFAFEKSQDMQYSTFERSKLYDKNFSTEYRFTKTNEISLIYFSDQGEKLAKKITAVTEGTSDKNFPPKKTYLADISDGRNIFSLNEWCAQRWNRVFALIFIGATGIAVRTIAPFLKSKLSDPAVLSIDDAGHYMISLLSGHTGGANALARYISEAIDARPIISTATDIHGVFAADIWAKSENIYLVNPNAVKTLSAALLAGKTVGLKSDFPVQGNLPEGLFRFDTHAGFKISSVPCLWIGFYPPQKIDESDAQVLYAVPKILVLGLGCKRGTSCKEIETAFFSFIKVQGFCAESFSTLASIDFKKDEGGIQDFAQKYKLNFQCFSAKILNQTKLPDGENFTSSDFVKKITGTNNVCERSAYAAAMRAEHTSCPPPRFSKKAKLIIKKQIYEGISLAVAAPCFCLKFSENSQGCPVNV